MKSDLDVYRNQLLDLYLRHNVIFLLLKYISQFQDCYLSNQLIVSIRLYRLSHDFHLLFYLFHSWVRMQKINTYFFHNFDNLHYNDKHFYLMYIII